MNRFVYLDNNATTKLSKIVQEKIQPFIDLQFGNPSSIYQHGVKIKKEVEEARKNCAKLIGCISENLIFTSGGSESNCSAINSAFCQSGRKKIVTTKVEHSSILEYCHLIKKRGAEIVKLGVDQNCKLDLNELEKAVDKNTSLLSVQFANNEVGTILLTDEVIEKIKALKKKYRFLFHVDGVQALGKIKVDVEKLGADFVSFSGHKIHCPKGIGLLYIKDTEKFIPLIAGHQERNLRGGTENVLGIVALGAAAKYIDDNFDEIDKKIKGTHDYLESQLMKIPDLTINCQKVNRIANTTSITFKKTSGNQLMFKLDQKGICVSTGSACNSESSEPSYVLTSMKIKNPQNTIRVSVDENTTKSQIDYFVANLKEIIYENR